MSRAFNWERANQRDQRRGSKRKVPIASTVPERVPTQSQLALIARLAAGLGIDPPFVATRRGASYLIESLKRQKPRS
jgi:hypothetical protein